MRSASGRVRPSGRAEDAIRDAEGMANFNELERDLREFVIERNWGRFHDPKSLLLALSAEVGELCEVFQWIPAAEAADRAGVEPTKGQVADEIADVLIYLLHLSDAVGVDPLEAAESKLNRNRKRFPVPAAPAVDHPASDIGRVC